MNTRKPDWDLYRSFLAVAREGSLSAAARSLGLTQPTLARHVEDLERALGTTLFVRSQRGLSPTDVARSLIPHAETLAATADALIRAASGDGGDVAGTVRISASEIMGAEVLPPILAALRERHPALAFELVLTNAVEDLMQREADIAVRMVAPTQGALVARHVGRIPLGFHAHRRYLDRAGTPRTTADLAAHALIGFDRGSAAIRAMAARVPALDGLRFALATDSDIAQLAAIRAGFGIGICQVPIAARDPDLVRLLPDAVTLSLDTWIVMHEDLRASPRCRATFDGLVEGLAPAME
ncbi:DNA-binding transcriptional regulator, LysR family [Pseudoxanthobacter soli DSM 19599]|uniref:DNA-binding transcriptional regulator, LysR family n=1 Tax=Pseudoxanthobacter soli DSM 19599 TaxID=1123029 RepID=A0A1M7ZD78_9HYPH|nr:LysR family transcriptional regulator [Pseudoxanthobacter soli]SHO62824.1 DNA-binding transcriptional regulator, LysR family [Pseudoxanthobacter soli DSM 19599]